MCIAVAYIIKVLLIVRIMVVLLQLKVVIC